MKKQFLDRGYKEYKEPQKRFLQKAITDEKGKKYFINVNIHDWRIIKGSILDNEYPDFTYDADVQFNHEEHDTFNVELLYVKSPEQVEEFFEKIFITMNCEYYELYH